MKINAERLIEAFGEPGWEVSGKIGELELFNPDKTRKLTYRTLGEGDHGSFAVLGISCLGENGGWTDVLTMRYFVSEGGEEVSFTVTVCLGPKDDPVVEEMISYDLKLGRQVKGMTYCDTEYYGRMAFDRNELLFEIDHLPANIDFEATANLFIEQMVRGEMTRPVLVPIEADI